MVHYALEGYFRNGRTYEAAHKAFAKAVNDSYEDLAEAYGSLWSEAEIEYRGLVEGGARMLEHYVTYDHDADYQFKPITVERRAFIPLPGTKHVLTGRLDIFAREVHSGMLAVIDHKTSSGSHATGRMLDIDEQGTSYSYIVWRVLNQIPLFVYDVIKTDDGGCKVPKAPRILKSGALSKDKSQGTTFEQYLAAIRERGEDTADFEYEEILEVLRVKGWSDFFVREVSQRNLPQLLSYERRVMLLFAEMERVLADPSLAIPNPSPFRCSGCPYLTVCTQMEDGSDYQYTLDTAYKQGNAYEQNRTTRKEPA
jgi:hypothetical protein